VTSSAYVAMIIDYLATARTSI